MKFLCLPGAYGSAKNFEVQFGPLAEEFKRRGLGSFTYSQGTHEVGPPPGWEDYFGKPPLYRFLDVSHGDAFETLRRLRHVPRGLNPEDTMRQLQSATEEEDWHQEAWREALDGVFKTVDDDPEINAIIGYSEGAMVAASFIVEEQERCLREKGRERRIKFGIFIAGAPPLKFEGNKRITAQLFDEVGAVINIPTLHIFGCDDAFLTSAVALFNVCDPHTAVMYDHGLGHIVPRDAENVYRLGTVLENIVPKVEEQIRREAQLTCSSRKDNRRGEVEREGQGHEKGQQQHGQGQGQGLGPGQGQGGGHGGVTTRPGMHQRGCSHLSATSTSAHGSDPITTSGSITPAEVDFTVAMLRRTDI
ncbi:serine hydrolase-domain-containing protein [Pseudoneurospora amorphoporcata]|uniref:Serine hydrolase-domain-containing protein n=1 Tax=Pseudoneurospora amorphoporcata TaxID=241081 RepID=A0AAN6SDB3_9PEZI|nr:serine hydrolase-domain-containing protein [Pseudoneurospora amorphoporcata]